MWQCRRATVTETNCQRNREGGKSRQGRGGSGCQGLGGVARVKQIIHTQTTPFQYRTEARDKRRARCLSPPALALPVAAAPIPPLQPAASAPRAAPLRGPWRGSFFIFPAPSLCARLYSCLLFTLILLRCALVGLRAKPTLVSSAGRQLAPLATGEGGFRRVPGYRCDLLAGWNMVACNDLFELRAAVIAFVRRRVFRVFGVAREVCGDDLLGLWGN